MGVAVKNPDGLCGRWTTLGLVSPGDARALHVELGRETGESAKRAAAALSPFCDPQRRGLAKFWLGGWTPKLQVALASEEQVRAEWSLVEALLAHKDLILSLAHRLGMDRRRSVDPRRTPSGVLFEEPQAFDGAPLSRVPRDALSRIAGVTFEDLSPRSHARRGRAFALWASMEASPLPAHGPQDSLLVSDLGRENKHGFVDRKGHLQDVVHARLHESAAQAMAFAQAHPNWFSAASRVAVMELGLEVEALEAGLSTLEPDFLLGELAQRERQELAQALGDSGVGASDSPAHPVAANDAHMDQRQKQQELHDALGLAPLTASLSFAQQARQQGLSPQTAWAVWGQARSREGLPASDVCEGFFNMACQPGPLSAAALSVSAQAAQQKWSGQCVAIVRVKAQVQRLTAWVKAPQSLRQPHAAPVAATRAPSTSPSWGAMGEHAMQDVSTPGAPPASVARWGNARRL